MFSFLTKRSKKITPQIFSVSKNPFIEPPQQTKEEIGIELKGISPVQRVLQAGELLQQILLFLPIKDLITSQLVNQTFWVFIQDILNNNKFDEQAFREFVTTLPNASLSDQPKWYIDGVSKFLLTRKLNSYPVNLTSSLFKPVNEKTIKCICISDSPETANIKTRYIKRIVHNVYSSNYNGPIGINLCLKMIGNIRVQLWDIPGQESFRNMSRVYWGDAEILLLFANSIKSFQAVVALQHKSIIKLNKENINLQVYLVICPILKQELDNDITAKTSFEETIRKYPKYNFVLLDHDEENHSATIERFNCIVKNYLKQVTTVSADVKEGSNSRAIVLANK